MAGRTVSERLSVGEDAWLIPRTIGCASACWSQPKVTVIAIEEPYVLVRLPDFTEVRVHADNVRRTPPPPPPDRRPVPRPRLALTNAEEIPLW